MSSVLPYDPRTAGLDMRTGRDVGQLYLQLCTLLGVQPRVPPEEVQRGMERLRNGVVRGAVIGFTLRGGLHLLGAALAPLSAGRRKRRSVTLPEALHDTLRYTAFLAALAGLYIGVDEGIAAAWGKKRTAQWRSLVAGLCAGPALLLTGRKNRHFSLATYILLRGVTLLVRTGNRSQRCPWLHLLLAPTRLEHGDTLLMCLSCSQVIYAFLMMPQTLPMSYVRFIRKQGAKELYVWQGIRELAQRTSRGAPPGPLTSLMGTPHAHTSSPTPCHFFHPGQGCWGHAGSLLPPTYRRALSVYLPVYLLPALLVHRQELLRSPGQILAKVLLGTARSSLFLSLYICAAFSGACAGHRLHGRSTGSIIASSVWTGGLATLIEKKSRRMELALYVLSRSLESFSRCLIEWRVIPIWALPPRLDVLLFAAGVGAILHCYSDGNGRHRGVFRSKYLNVLDFVMGNAGIDKGAIKHIPSNQDILTSVQRRVRSFTNIADAAAVAAAGVERTPSPALPSSSFAPPAIETEPDTAAAAAAVGQPWGSSSSSTHQQPQEYYLPARGHPAAAGSSQRPSHSWQQLELLEESETGSFRGTFDVTTSTAAAAGPAAAGEADGGFGSFLSAPSAASSVIGSAGGGWSGEDVNKQQQQQEEGVRSAAAEATAGTVLTAALVAAVSGDDAASGLAVPEVGTLEAGHTSGSGSAARACLQLQQQQQQKVQDEEQQGWGGVTPPKRLSNLGRSVHRWYDDEKQDNKQQQQQGVLGTWQLEQQEQDGELMAREGGMQGEEGLHGVCDGDQQQQQEGAGEEEGVLVDAPTDGSSSSSPTWEGGEEQQQQQRKQKRAKRPGKKHRDKLSNEPERVAQSQPQLLNAGQGDEGVEGGEGSNKEAAVWVQEFVCGSYDSVGAC